MANSCYIEQFRGVTLSSSEAEEIIAVVRSRARDDRPVHDNKQADEERIGQEYLKSSDRFFTAAQSAPPTDQQRIDSGSVRAAVVELGSVIGLRVPDGRDKSLALTALEDVLMRANRGIFAPQPKPLIDDSNFDDPHRVSPRD